MSQAIGLDEPNAIYSFTARRSHLAENHLILAGTTSNLSIRRWSNAYDRLEHKPDTVAIIQRREDNQHAWSLEAKSEFPIVAEAQLAAAEKASSKLWRTYRTFPIVPPAVEVFLYHMPCWYCSF